MKKSDVKSQPPSKSHMMTCHGLYNVDWRLLISKPAVHSKQASHAWNPWKKQRLDSMCFEKFYSFHLLLNNRPWIPLYLVAAWLLRRRAAMLLRWTSTLESTRTSWAMQGSATCCFMCPICGLVHPYGLHQYAVRGCTWSFALHWSICWILMALIGCSSSPSF